MALDIRRLLVDSNASPEHQAPRVLSALEGFADDRRLLLRVKGTRADSIGESLVSVGEDCL